MNNTIAEAEELIQALLPRVGAVEDVDIVVAPAFLSLQAVVDSARGSAVAGLRAEHAREGLGRVHRRGDARRCSRRSTSQGVILGHSERRQYFGETDKALQQKVPRALEAGLIPILCVGETEEERERGDTERKLRHQVQEGLEKVPLERLHEVVVAYEPIWAIGTGLTATPEQAQDAIAFVRALVQGFDKEAGNQVRVLYGGSMKADNAAELLAQPDIDGGLIGGASLDAESFAAIVEAARGMSVPRSRLVVLDGWGLAPDGPGQRGLAGEDAGVRRAVGQAPAHDADRDGPERRAARGADGQLRGRAPQPRGRRDRPPGPGPHRRRGRGRHAGRERGAAGGAARTRRACT